MTRMDDRTKRLNALGDGLRAIAATIKNGLVSITQDEDGTWHVNDVWKDNNL